MKDVASRKSSVDNNQRSQGGSRERDAAVRIYDDDDDLVKIMDQNI